MDEEGTGKTGRTDSDTGTAADRAARRANRARIRAALYEWAVRERLRQDLDDNSGAEDDLIKSNNIADLEPAARVLCCLRIDHPLRVWCTRLSGNKWFENGVLFVILASTVLLAFDDVSVQPGSTMEQVLKVADYITTALFSAEMLVKVTSVGLVLHPTAYLRSGWNILDFVVVLGSVLDVFVLQGAGVVKSFRALRALRPLRMVRHHESMMVVVVSMFRALPAICNVLLIAGFVFFVFGIMGVNMFSGKFYNCESLDPTVISEFDAYSLDRAQCEALGSAAIWKNPDVANFDNVLYAMLALFEIGSLEMWPDVLYRAVDVVGVDEAPIRDHSKVNALFFVVFIIVGNFFITNLFAGVVVDTFNHVIDGARGRLLLSERQQQWVDIQRMVVHSKSHVPLRPPLGRWRLRCFSLVTSLGFENAVAGLIVVNVLVMAVAHYPSSQAWDELHKISNTVFTFLFLAEALLKLTGLGVQYLTSYWNLFDLSIVVLALIGLELWSSVDLGFDPSVLRIFTGLRVLRLLHQARGLRKLADMLKLAVPSLLNVGGLLVLLHVVYAVSGMALFGGIEYRGFINQHANFDSFPAAMVTLFRVLTGESYNGIMHDCMLKHPPLCEPDDAINCGNHLSIPFFVSFTIIGQYMILNLFIAVVLQEFEAVSGSSTKGMSANIEIADLNEYTELWELQSDVYREHRPRTWLEKLGLRAAAEEHLPWAMFRNVACCLQRELRLIEPHRYVKHAQRGHTLLNHVRASAHARMRTATYAHTHTRTHTPHTCTCTHRSNRRSRTKRVAGFSEAEMRRRRAEVNRLLPGMRLRMTKLNVRAVTEEGELVAPARTEEVPCVHFLDGMMALCRFSVKRTNVLQKLRQEHRERQRLLSTRGDKASLREARRQEKRAILNAMDVVAEEDGWDEELDQLSGLGSRGVTSVTAQMRRRFTRWDGHGRMPQRETVMKELVESVVKSQQAAAHTTEEHFLGSDDSEAWVRNGSGSDAGSSPGARGRRFPSMSFGSFSRLARSSKVAPRPLALPQAHGDETHGEQALELARPAGGLPEVDAGRAAERAGTITFV